MMILISKAVRILGRINSVAIVKPKTEIVIQTVVFSCGSVFRVAKFWIVVDLMKPPTRKIVFQPGLNRIVDLEKCCSLVKSLAKQSKLKVPLVCFHLLMKTLWYSYQTGEDCWGFPILDDSWRLVAAIEGTSEQQRNLSRVCHRWICVCERGVRKWSVWEATRI